VNHKKKSSISTFEITATDFVAIQATRNQNILGFHLLTHLTRRDEQGSFPAEFGKLIVEH